MNTAQIAYVFEHDPKTGKKFCGVFPSDKLPQTIDKYPCVLLVNTDPSTMGRQMYFNYLDKLQRHFG